MEKFERDLDFLYDRLCEGVDEEVKMKLEELKNRLVDLRVENLVKISHSIMELVCAKYLILKGYEVSVEHLLDSLSCDLYAVKGYGNLIVEVETGFVPPEHALDPEIYLRARIASKITRYSNYANKLGLGTPSHYIMQIPDVLSKPPRYRTMKEVKEIKALCDLYYKNPPVSITEIRNARLHAVYILNVDKTSVKEIDPAHYIEETTKLPYILN